MTCYTQWAEFCELFVNTTRIFLHLRRFLGIEFQ